MNIQKCITILMISMVSYLSAMEQATQLFTMKAHTTDARTDEKKLYTAIVKLINTKPVKQRQKFTRQLCNTMRNTIGILKATNATCLGKNTDAHEHPSDCTCQVMLLEHRIKEIEKIPIEQPSLLQQLAQLAVKKYKKITHTTQEYIEQNPFNVKRIPVVDAPWDNAPDMLF